MNDSPSPPLGRVSPTFASFRRILVLVLSGATLTACGDHAPRQCLMLEAANLPVLNDRGQPLVQAGINGTPVAFMIDTGAAASVVTSSVVNKLELPVDYQHTIVMNGTGGSTMTDSVRIDTLTLGPAHARRADFWRADFPRGTINSLPVAGLFGGDFLANYDVEFDLPDHRVSLYRERNCGSQVMPNWPDPLYSVPFRLERNTAVMLTMLVNDVPVDAELDSGAGRTVLDLDAARAAGVRRADLAPDQSYWGHGIDGNRTEAFLHRFNSLTLGAERRSPARLAVSDIQTGSLLGADFLRTHRVWISYPHDILWVHPVVPVRQVEESSPSADTRAVATR
jgi:predicted aspartyl protease